jgi:hypothetical protein
MTWVTALSTTGRAATGDREAATLHLHALTPGDRSPFRTWMSYRPRFSAHGTGLGTRDSAGGDLVRGCRCRPRGRALANAAAWVVTQGARGDAGGYVGGAELPA